MLFQKRRRFSLIAYRLLILFTSLFFWLNDAANTTLVTNSALKGHNHSAIIYGEYMPRFLNGHL